METGSEVTPRSRLGTLRLSAIIQSICLPLAIGGPAFYVFADYVAVAPWGFNSLKILSSLLWLPMLASLPAIVIATLLLMHSSLWRYAANILVLFVLFLTFMWFAMDWGQMIRHQGFVDLANRSKPLVQAIHAYEKYHGEPPLSLSDLVPDYMPAVPDTGLGAYPEYEYLSSSQQGIYPYHGQPWVLSVYTPSAVQRFDEFFYFPSQRYPAYGYGGEFERIGDWAYLHE